MFINAQPHTIFHHPKMFICPDDDAEENNENEALDKQTKELFLQKFQFNEGI